MSQYLRTIGALYVTRYERRLKSCKFCGTPFSDVTKRNLQKTCSQQCSSAMMVTTRRIRGNYEQTSEQREKKSVSCKATYASRDVFGPELRKKFSETMKRTWERTRTNSKSNVLGGVIVHHLQREGRTISSSKGRSGRRDDLGNLFFRSRWEANVARVFNFQGKKWVFEPQIFILETTSYTPDFWLPDEKIFVEVKGYMNEISQRKLDEFTKYHPEHTVQIIGREEYDQFKFQYADKIAEWE